MTAKRARTTYSYDAGGQRVAQTMPAGDVIYYLGDVEITRSRGGQIISARRTFTHGGVVVAVKNVTTKTKTQAASSLVSWLVGNTQGSVTLTVTNGKASTRWYSPYGGTRGPKPAVKPTSTGFLNQHEDNTGLVYLNNRYYDPASTTFISVDPLITKTGQPYIYAGGNPAVFKDPNGLCWAEWLCGAGHRLSKVGKGVANGAADVGRGYANMFRHPVQTVELSGLPVWPPRTS